MKGQTRVENILKIILFSSFSLLSLLTLLFSCFMLYMNKKVQSDLYFGLISTILGLFFPSPITSFNIRNRHNNKIDNIIKSEISLPHTQWIRLSIRKPDYLNVFRMRFQHQVL